MNLKSVEDIQNTKKKFKNSKIMVDNNQRINYIIDV